MKTTFLNHAGTSWPKLACVTSAAASVYQHDPADWAALFRGWHATVAGLFHVDPTRLLLTPSCTAALSLGISDHSWQPGDRILTSRYEHHALYRAVLGLQRRGVELRTIPGTRAQLLDLEALEVELKTAPVRLVAMTAACNVTGQRLPIAETIELAHQYKALVLIDGAQIAGWWDLDLTALNVDLFTFAGHKGPQAPWGIGGLYVAPHVGMNSPHATCGLPEGEGAPSCAPMPGYCDAGSVNLSALAGLAAACDWLNEPAQRDRLERALQLTQKLAAAMRELPGVTLHGDVTMEHTMPTVAISVEGRSSLQIAQTLADRGLVVAGGFQCAPEAHRALGTDQDGVVRFSFGPTSREDEMHAAVEHVSAIVH